jgi:hypothetical protein
MKKVYSVLVALLIGFSANAQRVIDLSTTLSSPAANATITSGVTSVAINAVVKNLGPDSLEKVADSIFYQYLIDNQVLTITIGSQQTTTFARTGVSLKVNDTVHINRNITITFPSSLNGTHQLCVAALPVHRGTDTIADNVVANNIGCVTVNLVGGTNDINEITGNADENVVTNVYPVPAQNVANIDIALANKSTVTVRIADLMGRNMSVENKGTFNKGQHTISVNTSALPAGIYTYQVTMNDQVSTGKLVIAK